MQLNYSTNIHLLIPRFMKSLCVITIELNTLTNVPYQMTVGGALVSVFSSMVITHKLFINRGINRCMLVE